MTINFSPTNLQARPASGNNFRASISRTAPSRNRNDAQEHHRQRELRLREREETHIEAFRGSINQALVANAAAREQRDNVLRAREAISGQISHLQSLTASENETATERTERISRLISQGLLPESFDQNDYNRLMSHINQEIREIASEIPAVQEELEQLEENLIKSDEQTAQRVAMLEEMINSILENRAERDRLNLAIELKLLKIDPEEDNAQADALLLLSHARDKLTEKSLEIPPEQTRQRERIQAQIDRLNSAIEKQLDLDEIIQGFVYPNDDDDDSVINLQL
ncbi:MAG: hypothetical protein FWB80_05010 [Defluviitaleaceae bacterium]|nr:hypothetical protein [Defluviitaleaceae bacterium]